MYLTGKVKILNATAIFELVTYRFVVKCSNPILQYHFDVSNNLEGGGGAKYIKLCFILIFISIISLSENGGVPYHLKGFHIFWILGRLCFFNWHINLALLITTFYYVFWCFFQI